jgi:hypothetical protein
LRGEKMVCRWVGGVLAEALTDGLRWLAWREARMSTGRDTERNISFGIARRRAGMKLDWSWVIRISA